MSWSRTVFQRNLLEFSRILSKAALSRVGYAQQLKCEDEWCQSDFGNLDCADSKCGNRADRAGMEVYVEASSMKVPV